MLSKRATALALSATSLALTLSACAGSRTVARPTRLPLPASLLTCRDEPRAPSPSTATDADVARWEIELIAAGCDCRAKLAALRALDAGETAPAKRCTIR